MNKVIVNLLFLLTSFGLVAGNIDKIDPPCWFTGMNNPELQLMVYGNHIGDATFSVDYPGVKVDSVVKLESPNYLLVYLNIDKTARAGKMKLTFKNGGKKYYS
jgi:hypothetical protein